MLKDTTWTADASCGRDAGKTFLIREMPADQTERVCMRFFFALANGSAKLPTEVMDAGIAGLASLGIGGAMVLALRNLQGVRYEDVAPLLDELMDCVQFKPPGDVPAVPLFVGRNCQIEEMNTRVKLKWEVVKLHVDFSAADAPWSSPPSGAAPASA